ncbi:MAG: SDR family oxidoreductase [Bacteroidota bacterium]|nr:SDR family oxidoreductase [Bacteroidota bacterium]
MSLSGKIVWITGASSGIGRSLAIECARQGAHLMLTARRQDALEATKSACERSDEHAWMVQDVTDRDSHDRVVKAILERWGRLDVLVLNAGIGQRGSVAETDPQVERRVMEVNYFGQTEVLHAVLPHFLERNAGQIVVVSSIMGKLSTPRRATYAASKHALHGFFEGLRAETVHTGIDITLLCTGYIKTDISYHSVKGSGQPYGDMDDQHRNAMGTDAYARKAVRAIMKKKPVAYIGGPERFAPILERLSPALVRFLLPRVVTRD